MTLQPCDTCGRETYNGCDNHGARVCDPCRDSLAYVRKATVDDLRDLIGGGAP